MELPAFSPLDPADLARLTLREARLAELDAIGAALDCADAVASARTIDPLLIRRIVQARAEADSLHRAFREVE